MESEALDAVRLMTIHRSKGLEFPVVCVADLGRSPRADYPLVRVGRDGSRLGLTLREPGTGPLLRALDYDALAAEQRERDRAEERRLFYVAMTRAKERLLVSGAARPTLWEAPDPPTPIGWIAPALVPDLATRMTNDELEFTSEGVAVRFISDAVTPPQAPAGRVLPNGLEQIDPRPTPEAPAAVAGREMPTSSAEIHPPIQTDRPERPPPSLATLSYTALSDYHRCGYRFYVQRVLGLPELQPDEPAAAAPTTAISQPGGAARGTAIHALLQAFDFQRLTAAPAADTPPDLMQLVRTFAASATAERLAQATDLRREQQFAFPFGETLITGVFDVIARQPDGSLLVVDYKSDRLRNASPEELTHNRYADQRIVYALAALRTQAPSVEVLHLFLEDPSRPVSKIYRQADITRLEFELEVAAAGLLAGDYPVTDNPYRNICQGCPAAGGLCPYPVELTTRPEPTAAPELRLF